MANDLTRADRHATKVLGMRAKPPHVHCRDRGAVVYASGFGTCDVCCSANVVESIGVTASALAAIYKQSARLLLVAGASVWQLDRSCELFATMRLIGRIGKDLGECKS